MSDITYDRTAPEPKPSRSVRRVTARAGAATIGIIVASAIALQARDAPAATSRQRVTGERTGEIHADELRRSIDEVLLNDHKDTDKP